MLNQIHDAIVLGAGPAGLGSAIHLAEKGMSVLVVEKEKIGSSSKTWLTFDATIYKYGLADCVRNRFSDIVFSCYLGGRYHFRNRDFIQPLHEERALLTLARRAEQAGAVILGEEAFLNYSIEGKDDPLTIRTAGGSYRARIAVDAMGRYSPILRSCGLENPVLDMGCLAFFLDGVNQKMDNRLLLYDSFFPGTDYFWVVPLEDDKLMAGIFFFSPLNRANLPDKKDKLEFYLRARNIKGKVYDTRMGNIPLGGQVHLNHERILSLGDSCNTPLPSSGFSFSRCLAESEVLAEFALNYLDGKVSLKDYKKEILAEKIPAIEIHLMISDMLSKFTDPMLNKAIAAMSGIHEDFLISFLSGRDMSIQFTVTALGAILNTFSLSDLRSISLKQRHMKNLGNLYNLLPALPQARLGEQLVQFVKGLVNNRYPAPLPTPSATVPRKARPDRATR